MTPEEVVKNIDRLNGVKVTVGGYLAECSGYDCVLYTDKKQATLADDWFKRLMAAARAKQSPASFPEDPAPSWYVNSLGIGAGKYVCLEGKPYDCSSEFDRKAAPFRHSYVLISGKVTNRCRWKGEPGCTDRSTDLEPISIRAWHRQESSS